MTNYRKLDTITSKIKSAREQTPALTIEHNIIDGSVQAEVRLTATAQIRVAVDEIGYPKNLSRDDHPAWPQMSRLASQVRVAAIIHEHTESHSAAISAKTKTGPALRASEIEAFKIRSGNALLAAIAAARRQLKPRRMQIAALQAEQKKLIAEMRAHNSAHIATRKAAGAQTAAKNTQALTSGRFWEATADAIKSYFHPPFAKNHLADVSAQWRAALFLECESTGWQANNGNWRHKLVGTGRAYLCGIDDNGDEWGHHVRLELGCDDHGNVGLEASVEDAMAELFDISARKLDLCTRQGDLLFCPDKIPAERVEYCRLCGHKKNTRLEYYTFEHGSTETAEICTWCGSNFYPNIVDPVQLHPQDDPWEIRESHTIASPGLERNGRYFKSATPITVTHTSHAPVELPAGEYRLYTLQVADAD